MLDEDIRDAQQRYTQRFQEFGRTPQSLGWKKGKQAIRFDVLTSQYDFAGKSVLDIGCGFGDLLDTLGTRMSRFTYTGIDLVDAFIREARSMHPGHTFIQGDFISHDFGMMFDYCVASGIFNHKLKQDNYEFIRLAIQKAWDISCDGFAFDFLSDRVDYPLDHTFHSNPTKILEFAYSLSRNVVLRNDYMPFEFSLFVFKDDSFAPEDTLFHRYKAIQGACPK